MGVPATATPADMGIYNKPEIVFAEIPGTRQDNQRWWPTRAERGLRDSLIILAMFGLLAVAKGVLHGGQRDGWCSQGLT